MSINEFKIAKSLQINSLTVRNELNVLDQIGIIDYKEANSNEELTFLTPREDDKTINRISSSIEKFLHNQIQKSEDLIYFIKNNNVCRSIQLSHYFGEKKEQRCGNCDYCKERNKLDLNEIEFKNISDRDAMLETC